MAMKILMTLALSGLSVSACFNAPITAVGSISSSGVSNKLAALGTTESKSVSTVDPNSTSDIQLSAPAIRGMEGAGVKIAPGSLGIAVDLVVEEAADIGNTSMMSEMGLADDIGISSASPGMIIRPSENVDLKKPLAISMPLPVGLSFHLSGGSKYAIIYKYFDPTEQKLVSGMKIMDGTTVKLVFDEASGKDLLNFDGYFGAYWAVILNREVKAAEVPPPKPAEQPIMNKANVPVISSAGAMSEKNIVTTQAVVELVWSKTSIKFNPETRRLSLQVAIPTGQKVSGCKADLFESQTAKSGLVIESPEGPQLEIAVRNPNAHTLVGRFRCLDSLGRITFSPWSDSTAIAAVPAPVTAAVAAPVAAVPSLPEGFVTISGKLVPANRGLLFVTSSGGEGDSAFKEIAVDATGNFSITVDTLNASAGRLKAKIAANSIVRDADFIADIAATFQVSIAEAQQHINNMPDDNEIRADMLGEIEKNIQTGTTHTIVAYTKNSSDNRIAEASSFKFIGLPTASGKPLFHLNSKKLKGNVNLGELNVEPAGSTSDEVLSGLAASSAVSETTEMMNGLAAMGGTVKSVRNDYMNVEGLRADPTFQWRSTATLADVTAAFPDPSTNEYQGYSFQIEGNDRDPPPYTFNDICNSTRKLLSFSPPSDVNVMIYNTSVSLGAFTNAGSYGSGSEGSRWCDTTHKRFYAREDGDRLRIQFPSGPGIQGEIPPGLWRYNYDGQELARFSHAYFRPMDANNKPTIFVPTFKLIKNGDNYVGATVKFSQYVNGVYLLLTDHSVVNRLALDARVSMWGPGVSNNDAEIIFTDGIGEATVSFEQPISSSANSAAVEYSMGGQRYRFEISPNI